ncbi:MAG: adenylate/guanylate cyclase domain-containing protein, partial [Hyphomicrobiales bacterium]
MIGHPEGKTAREGANGPELVPRKSMRDEKLAKGLRHTKGVNGDERHFEVVADGERYLAVSAPFADDGKPDWIVLIAVPAEALLGRIYENNRTAAWIAALAALASVLIGIFIAERTMGRALRGIATDLDQVGRLDFSARNANDKSAIREIVAMHAARDRMTHGLRSFAKYVPAGLVRDLMQRGQEAALGGETRELTVYFADIADFTSIAEKLSPNELVDQLGNYFEEMSALIRTEHGTVDKFIGDAIMAFWGAPQEVDDHALRACKAALACQARLASLRQDAASKGLAEFRARIGINTGDVLVGNIGSDERMNYTVMGDPVNVASRLEMQCKRAKVGIIIGQRTRELAGEVVVARPLEKLAVKGKEEGIIVYELMALREDATPDQLRAEALGE